MKTARPPEETSDDDASLLISWSTPEFAQLRRFLIESMFPTPDAPAPDPEVFSFKGTGSFGSVFRWVRDGEPFAFKQMLIAKFSPVMEKSLRIEFKSLLRAKHPNVMRVFGFSLVPPIGLLVEYFEADVNTLLAEGALSSWEDKLKVILETSEAMFYLHNECCLIHRDLKWSNVMLSQDPRSGAPWRVAIIDFGLAVTRASVTTSGASTQLEGGTVGYMAPELYDKVQRDFFSYPADVFAFGIMLYALVAGTPHPYGDALGGVVDEASRLAAARKIQEGLRPDLSLLPRELLQKRDDKNWVVRLMEACWSADPRERPTFGRIVCLARQKSGFRHLTGMDQREMVKKAEDQARLLKELLKELHAAVELREVAERTVEEEREVQQGLVEDLARAENRCREADRQRQDVEIALREVRLAGASAEKALRAAIEVRDVAERTAQEEREAKERALLEVRRLREQLAEAEERHHKELEEARQERRRDVSPRKVCPESVLVGSRDGLVRHISMLDPLSVKSAFPLKHDGLPPGVAGIGHIVPFGVGGYVVGWYHRGGRRVAKPTSATVFNWIPEDGADRRVADFPWQQKRLECGVFGMDVLSTEGSGPKILLGSFGAEVGQLVLWDVASLENPIMESYDDVPPCVQDIKVDGDDNKFYVGGGHFNRSSPSHAAIRVYDVQRKAPLLRIQGHAVNGLAVTPDRLISSSVDRTVKVWDPRSGADCVDSATLTGVGQRMCYAPDLHKIVVCVSSGSSAVEVFDLRRMEEAFKQLPREKGITDCYRVVRRSETSKFVTVSHRHVGKFCLDSGRFESVLRLDHSSAALCNVMLEPE